VRAVLVRRRARGQLHRIGAQERAYGQFITVIPRLDVVVAHKASGTPARNVPADAYFGRILPGIVEVAGD
jgi:hypothetical protein